MNIHTDTFKMANALACIKMNGFLIDLVGEIALIRRGINQYGDQDKSYVISHFSHKTNSFYWSTYDLSLADAVRILNEEMGERL